MIITVTKKYPLLSEKKNHSKLERAIRGVEEQKKQLIFTWMNVIQQCSRHTDFSII